MGLLSKHPFEWREPREFRRALDAMRGLDARWWHRPLAGLVMSGMLLAGWAFARLIPNKRPPAPPPEVAIPFAIIAGPFLVYFLSWLHRVAPRNVIVRDDRLIQVPGMNGENHREWRFGNIEEYDLRDCGGFGVLVLSPRKGRQALIGVPPDVDLSSLDRFLSDRGLVRMAATGDRPSSRDAAWEAFESFLKVSALSSQSEACRADGCIPGRAPRGGDRP